MLALPKTGYRGTECKICHKVPVELLALYSNAKTDDKKYCKQCKHDILSGKIQIDIK